MTKFLSIETDEDVTRLKSVWLDAPADDMPMVCAWVLDVAREQVIAFASEREGDADFTWSSPPARFVLAQLMQAQNLFNAGRVSDEGNVGPDNQPSFTFQPRPMDKTIRGIIRPMSGVVDVF